MEVETMVLNDDGSMTRIAPKRRRPPKRSNKGRCNLLHLGFVCLGIAFLAIVAAITISISMPNIRKSSMAPKKNEDTQEIILKAMFSTNYTPDSEDQSLNIANINDIANQLNTKLNGDKIHLIGAFFRDYLLLNGYGRIRCENPLVGNALQLNIVASYSRQCASQNENICKSQRQEQLKNIFNRMLIIPITIQFRDNRFKSIDIKICALTDMTEQEEEEEGGKTTKTAIQRRKVKTTTTSVEMTTKFARYIVPNDVTTPYTVLKQSVCTLTVGRIILVQMTGAYGSQIQDATQTDAMLDDDQYGQLQTVTVYEDMTYRLHIQLDCNRKLGRKAAQRPCSPDQNVQVWIDFNDNTYDDGESRVLSRARSNGKIPANTYDLELYIPVIDGRNTRHGPHRMRLSVIPNEEYQRNCGTVVPKATREYTINIVPKATYSGVVDRAPANIISPNSICSLNTGRIAVVLMAGERGTEIRDDKPTNILLNNYPNQHHLAVTIYEHTVYLFRVQLDCSWQLNSDLFAHGCNLAQDVNVWIDLNDDGRFDQSEIGTPYEWPVTSYMPHGIYDLQIYIPLLDGRYMRSGQHRMRLVVMSSDNYRRICGRTDYNETRDYTVNIVPRTGYIGETDVSTPYMVLDNIVCSPHIGKIVLVLMAGEHRTQIRDDPSTRALLSNDNQNQRHQAIVLYEDTVYLLRIQLDCNRQWSSDLSEHSCNLVYDVNIWIDLNDDGIFDSTENAVPFRWPLHSYTPQGVYDLQIYIPVIDVRKMKSGPYRMQLVVTMNEQYRRKCGNNDYKETREYTVSIVPNNRQPVDVKLPYLALSDTVCLLSNGKISLVIMAGEQGTQIRDNIQTNALLSENQNRHHLAVTLYENTIYRLRIQLDCFQQSGGGLPDINCNFAQDVNVLIDFNNDDRYDETESRVPYRWPLRSAMPLGIYDFEIDIPAIDGLNTKSGSHRMRIVAIPSEEYRKKCGNTDYRETREYTLNIVPRAIHRDLEYRPPADPRIYPLTDSRATYCSPGNFACSERNSAISLVQLVGEQGTQILDNTKQCSSVNNYHDRSNLVVRLFDDTIYTLHIELYCVPPQGYENPYNQEPFLIETICNYAQYLGVWIDFNNDGVFDENREIIPDSRYNTGQRTAAYDLRINIPTSNGRSYLNEQHRMRLVLTQDDRNLKPCQNTGYGEARDYTIQIIPKLVY